MSESHTIGCNVLGFCGPEIVFDRRVDAPNEPMMSGSGAPTMSLSSASDDEMECELIQVKSIIKGDGLCGNQCFDQAHQSLQSANRSGVKS
jgi:hypothetical protein